MNDYDRELIVGMLDNSLSPEESEVAHARLETDTAFAAEYRTQQAVVEDLGFAERPSLTAAERSSLRSNLMDQLALDSSPKVVPVVQPSRGFRLWKPLAGLAAVAAVVAGFVIIPGTLGSSDGGADTAAFETATTSVDAGSSADGLTDASAETPTLEYAEAELRSVIDATGADVDDLLKAAAGESSPAEVEESLSRIGYAGSVRINGGQLEECLIQITPQLPPNTTSVLLLGVDPSGSSTIAHLGLTFSNGIEAAISLDLATCRIVTDDN